MERCIAPTMSAAAIAVFGDGARQGDDRDGELTKLGRRPWPSPQCLVNYEIESEQSWSAREPPRYVHELQLRAPSHLRARRASGDVPPGGDGARRRGGEQPPGDDVPRRDVSVSLPFGCAPLSVI